MDVMSIIKNQKMSKTKQLLDDMHSMDFYSVYADSDYWYNEWEKMKNLTYQSRHCSVKTKVGT
jgi:hypothetical protein